MLKSLLVLGGSAPLNICINLAFPIALTLLPMFVWYCYDVFLTAPWLLRFCRCWLCIISQLDQIIMSPSLNIWEWLQIGDTHFLTLHLEPLVKNFRNHPWEQVLIAHDDVETKHNMFINSIFIIKTTSSLAARSGSVPSASLIISSFSDQHWLIL